MATKQKKTKTLNPEQKSLLIHSILHFLERNGFSKALKRLLSETQIEDDKWKASSVDLEEMYCAYLDKGGYNDMDANTKKGQELKTNDITKKDGGGMSVETLTKKKKKRSNQCNDAVPDSSVAVDRLTETSKQNSADYMIDETHIKSKGTKKSKKNIDSLVQTDEGSKSLKESVDNKMPELQTNELTKKHKDNKNKKEKLTSETLDGGLEKEQLEVLQSDEFTKKDKDAKKKRNNLPYEPLDDNVDWNQLDSLAKKKKNETKSDLPAEKAEQCGLELKDKNGLVINNIGADSALKNACKIQPQEKKVKSKKKRKKEDFVSSAEPAEEFKRRKIEGLHKSEGAQLTNQVGDSVLDQSGKNGDGELQESSLRKPEEKEKGRLENNGIGRSAQKSTSKQQNGSAEPTSAKAFQRVKVDAIVFADKKLQDNSYWAKDGAEVGYGAKAQEVLGQVRGRDFRYEKTKKKRGSYRGGMIDLQSHSVKFSYSDDE